MNSTKTLRIMNVAVCLFAIAFGVLAQAQAPATSGATTPNPGLVNQLTKQLNITPEQAVGGTGAIFGLAKSQLNPAEFGKLSAAVPGMDGFLKAAPSAKGGTAANPLGSAGSMVPGAGSIAQGAGSMVPGNAGGIASLAGSFQSLGLSPGMVSKFAPVLENYVQKSGGPKTAALLTGVLH